MAETTGLEFLETDTKPKSLEDLYGDANEAREKNVLGDPRVAQQLSQEATAKADLYFYPY